MIENDKIPLDDLAPEREEGGGAVHVSILNMYCDTHNHEDA